MSAPGGEGEPRLVDALGLKCPLPVLMARRALSKTVRGGTIVVRADDPLARVDLPVMCRNDGHELVAIEPAEGGLIFRIRKG